MKTYKKLEACRICKSTDLETTLDLGQMPLVNSFLEKPGEPELFFPLEVLFCRRCWLSQLSIVVNPEILFTHYCYRSSISKSFHHHCQQVVTSCQERLPSKSGGLVIDIASNDGCLLQYFKASQFSVLGVEPAVNISKIAQDSGIPTVNQFWSPSVAREILQEFGPARVITGTNVFAHVDNVEQFVDGVAELLEDTGIFLLEFPYCIDLVERLEYDTIYHEHLSYFLLNPLLRLFAAKGMTVFDLQRTPIHGGSLRIFVKKEKNKSLISSNRVALLLKEEKEKGFGDLRIYKEFSRKVLQSKIAVNRLLTKLGQEGKTIIGFGASAKGNILLNYCQIGPDQIAFIVDDTPEKQNKFTPGMHIPIKESQSMEGQAFDYLFLLAWNFKEEIMCKTQDFQLRGGRYIIPIPEVAVVP